MERGVIDAFEFNNPTSDRRFGAQDVSKNYMMSSYHQATEYFEIIFNKTKYDSLAPGAAGDLEVRGGGGLDRQLRHGHGQLLQRPGVAAHAPPGSP